MSLSSGRARSRGPTAAGVLSPHSIESDESDCDESYLDSGQWLLS